MICPPGLTLQVEEWDILRSQDYDLSSSEIFDRLMQRIRSGAFHYIFMSPPCSTWSRARRSNFWGPRPLRNKQWPRGFPWLKAKYQELANLGNLLVDVCFQICLEVSLPTFPFLIRVIWEHPEDLGATRDQKGRIVCPASIWQLPEFQLLLSRSAWFTVAFFQCQFQVDRLKPTRLLSNLSHLQSWGPLGPPQTDHQGFYAGPLPRTCSHGGHPPLIKQHPDQEFATTGTGVYPPAMDLAFAQAILADFLSTSSSMGWRRSRSEIGAVEAEEVTLHGVTSKEEIGEEEGHFGMGQGVTSPEQGVTPMRQGVTPQGATTQVNPPTGEMRNGRKGWTRGLTKGSGEELWGRATKGRQGLYMTDWDFAHWGEWSLRIESNQGGESWFVLEVVFGVSWKIGWPRKAGKNLPEPAPGRWEEEQVWEGHQTGAYPEDDLGRGRVPVWGRFESGVFGSCSKGPWLGTG